MIANFPDYFKTVRIFPDGSQSSGLFQNCPDFSRWLPIFQMISKLSGCSRWLPIFRMISKLSRFFQMTANFPDDFKTVQIFQMTADFGCWKQRWPAPSQMSNLQTPLSRRLPSDRCVPSWRWDYQSELNISNNFQADIVAQHQSRIQMRKVGDELANSAWLYCNQSDSIAYSLFVDVFYRPTCTFVNSFHLRAAHFRLDTIVQWRSGKLLLRDPGTAMASTPSETTQWPIQERIYWLTSPQSQRWRKQTETFVFVVTVLRCQLKKSKCVVGLSRDGRNVSNQVL